MKQHIAKVSGVTAGTTKKNSVLFNGESNNCSNRFFCNKDIKKSINAIQMGPKKDPKKEAQEEEKHESKSENDKNKKDDTLKQDNNLEEEKTIRTHQVLKPITSVVIKIIGDAPNYKLANEFFIDENWPAGFMKKILKGRIAAQDSSCPSLCVNIVYDNRINIETFGKCFAVKKNHEGECNPHNIEIETEIKHYCKLLKIKKMSDVLTIDLFERVVGEYVVTHFKISDIIRAAEDNAPETRKFEDKKMQIIPSKLRKNCYMHITNPIGEEDNTLNLLNSGLKANKEKGITSNVPYTSVKAAYIKAFTIGFNFILKSESDFGAYYKLKKRILYVLLDNNEQKKLIVDLDSLGYKIKNNLSRIYCNTVNEKQFDELYIETNGSATFNDVMKKAINK